MILMIIMILAIIITIIIIIIIIIMKIIITIKRMKTIVLKYQISQVYIVFSNIPRKENTNKCTATGNNIKSIRKVIYCRY